MDPKELIPGCSHFTWREALWLPSWNRMAEESDGLTDEIKQNLISSFQWMETVRSYFDKPINVHVAYRPVAYNQQIGGALHSQHSVGCAVDFDVVGMSCDEVRAKILDEGKLDEWNLRMEDNGMGAGWIHLDSRAPGPGGRFFKP